MSRSVLFLLALLVGAAMSVEVGAQTTVAQFDFNNTLAATTAAQADLVPGASPPAETPGVVFEPATIGGNPADVARITGGTWFGVRTGAPSNGGGSFINDYTIIIDMQVPGRAGDCSGTWVALYSSALDNGSDGEAFINPNGGVGISGGYAGCVDGDWHRIAITVELSVPIMKCYVDGVEVNDIPLGSGVDGRWSLYSTDSPDGNGDDGFNLFGDNDGDVPPELLVNSMQFRDRVMTAEEIGALGGPSADGIPLPGGKLDACDVVLFQDNFNGYADDAGVTGAGWQIVDTNNPGEGEANCPGDSSTWTVTNPGGRANPPTFDGSPTTGGFMISDSDASCGNGTAGTGESYDLITPSFSTAGAMDVWLHVDCVAQLNDGADAVFDIDVSTDGGSTWSNAFERVSPGRGLAPVSDNSNADGFFGRLHVDLSGVAANAADVRVRFRHFEPTFDWFIAVDNVRVDCSAPPTGGDCVVLATQDFSAGLGSMSVVSGTGNTGTETWHTTDKGGRYAAGSVSSRGVNRLTHPDATPNFAILDSDANPDPAEDEFLVTPTFNLATFSEVFLHFKSEIVIDGDTTAEVLASIDGGATFPIRIFRYSENGGTNALFDSGEEPFYAERVFSVPEVAGFSQVAFAFHFQSGGNRWWWAIDDVQVTGTTDVCDPRDCGLRAFGVAYDAGTNTVGGSWDLLPGDEGFNVVRSDGAMVAMGLPSDATSFEDTSPPLNGENVSYTLQTFTGGAMDKECPSNEISTFVCFSGLLARADYSGGAAVNLSWIPGINLADVGGGQDIDVLRNGEKIATVSLGDASFTDDFAGLPGGKHIALSYELQQIAGDCASSSRVVVSTGNVFFADDFEGYGDDIELQLADYFIVDENNPIEDSTWTITNPGGRSNPPMFDGGPSSGNFMISDSDAQGGNNQQGGGMSHDLWLPSVNLSGGGGAGGNGEAPVWLHMDVSAQLNNNGTAVFDVDISTDGGVNWNNVFRRVAPCRLSGDPCGETEGLDPIEPEADNQNADGYYGKLSIDISGLAEGQSDVRVRLRHFEPDFDWWVAVDNVLIDDVPVVGGGEVLFAENFDCGLGAMTASSLVEPPNSGTETWHDTDKGGRFSPGAISQRGLNRIGHSLNSLSLVARLDGAQAAPDPVETDATGFGCFSYDMDTNELAFDISFEGLSSAETNAHIHDGDPGVPGPVAHGLPAGSPKVGSVTLSDDEEARLLAGGLYVNIHSENFGSGEIRGQILLSGFAGVDSDRNPDPAEDEYLTTPSIDCSNCEAVYLHWDSEALFFSDEVGEVLVSLDGGATYLDTPIFSYSGGGLLDRGEEPSYARRILEVPEAAGESDVVFAFHYQGGGNNWWWIVDNVQVTADLASLGTPFIRGDSNCDGGRDVSDGVFTLNFLFASGADPCCPEVSDTNGDGGTDVSDPIYDFNFLFSGGPPPPAPSPNCGTVEGVADCEAHPCSM